MGVFDFRALSREAAIELMTTSNQLAVYSNAVSFSYLPTGDMLNAVADMSGDFNANRIRIGLPDGWRELKPAELGLPDSVLDISGYYTIESSVTGDRPLNGTGPQLKILGEFDEQGQVTRLSVSFAGTNDLLDVADYFHLNEGKIAPFMNDILNQVKDYAIAHHLSAEDVIVTGYSLGGAMVNIMAKYRQELADGFFDTALYVGHASPLMYDNPDVVLNMGFDNDAVYRIIGDAPTFKDAVALMGQMMSNTDTNFDTSIDNIALFTGAYGSFLWDVSNPFVMSILNQVQGWASHVAGIGSNALERIGESPFYEFTDKDSRIIVDQLNIFERPFMWVKDKAKNADGTPAFIIGSDYANLLEDNKQGDYIDARAGNDRIRLSDGADRVNGGEGTDTVILQGVSQDWDAYRMSDGTLFMQSHTNTGIKQLENVEKLSFAGESFTDIRPYEIGDDAIYSHRYLIQSRNQDISYQDHLEGTTVNDVLTGEVVFGLAGDDTLVALENSKSLLDGGEGQDILIGNTGSDTLYGGEGHDYLYGGAGINHLYGGVGSDVFAFGKGSTGLSFVRDFNQYAGDHDTLVLSADLFASREEVLSASRAVGDDLHISKDGVGIILHNVSFDEFSQGNHISII